jgi:hypothetical protein
VDADLKISIAESVRLFEASTEISISISISKEC